MTVRLGRSEASGACFHLASVAFFCLLFFVHSSGAGMHLDCSSQSLLWIQGGKLALRKTIC